MRGLALLAALGGCGPKAPPPQPLDPATAHIGAWHGSGMAYPEGQLCLVFCPDGRLFSQAASCGALDAPKAWTWTRQDGVLMLDGDDRAVSLRFRASDRTTALVDIPGYPSLPLDRVGELHALCMDASVGG